MIDPLAPKTIALAPLAELIGYRPHAAQLKVHESTARYRVACWGVRAGKSICASVEALRAALAPGKYNVVWIVAPSYDLATKIFRELERMLKEHFPTLLVKERWSDLHCVITNLSGGQTEIRGKSADRPESLLGEGVTFVVVDEASRVKEEIWTGYLSQRLIDKRGRALLISTPNGRNWFWRMFMMGQPGEDKDPDYESWQFPSWVNPILPREDIEKERLRLPASAFAQEYEAAFTDGAGQVFRNIEACATLAWPSSKWIPPNRGDSYTPHERYTAGLDLAQVNDFTVLTILDSQRRVVFIDRFNKLTWDRTIKRVAASLQHYNNALCHVDATGVGSSIFERLKGEGLNVRGVTFTNENKTDIINNLAAMLEHQQVTLPQPRFAKELIEELQCYSYSTTDSGNVRMAAAGSGHDDCVISLALACWGNKVTSFARAQVARVGMQICPDEPSSGGINIASMGGHSRSSLGGRGMRYRIL
jgi:hypothetical protein